MRLFERPLVVAGLVEIEALGCKEAMAAGSTACLHTCEFEPDDLAVEQGHDPVDGPAECNLAGPPAHRLGEADALTKLREDLREDRVGCLARLVHLDADVVTLVGRLLAELFHAHTVLLGESACGLLGGAVRIECSAPRRAHDRLVTIGLTGREPPHSQREPPRRPHRVHLERVGPEPGLADQLDGARLHRAQRVRHERCR